MLKFLSEVGICLGGILPYIPQYYEIMRSKNVGTFSTYVCLVLLLSNILRILFWSCMPFAPALLYQSICMIITMLSLQELCVRVQKQKQDYIKVQSLIAMQFEDFWKWTSFQDYIYFLIAFSLLSSALTFHLHQHYIFVQFLGFLALGSEACLALPQLYENFKNESTEGMSVLMVVGWFFGDVFKTTYAILTESPTPFLLCGSLQIFIDILIFFQVYRSRKPIKRKTIQIA